MLIIHEKTNKTCVCYSIFILKAFIVLYHFYKMLSTDTVEGLKSHLRLIGPRYRSTVPVIPCSTIFISLTVPKSELLLLLTLQQRLPNFPVSEPQIAVLRGPWLLVEHTGIFA